MSENKMPVMPWHHSMALTEVEVWRDFPQGGPPLSVSVPNVGIAAAVCNYLNSLEARVEAAERERDEWKAMAAQFCAVLQSAPLDGEFEALDAYAALSDRTQA